MDVMREFRRRLRWYLQGAFFGALTMLEAYPLMLSFFGYPIRRVDTVASLFGIGILIIPLGWMMVQTQRQLAEVRRSAAVVAELEAMMRPPGEHDAL